MSIKNPLWLLLIAILLAVLSFYGLLTLEFALGFLIIYIFCLGLTIEFKEIKAREGLKSIVEENIGRVENLIISSVQKIDSDNRIKERLKTKKREIIEWLNKL